MAYPRKFEAMSMTTRVLAAALSGAALLLTVPDARAQQPVCGEPYTVQPGDTLSRITQRAYDGELGWIDVYEHGQNARVIGNNPHLLRVGDTISLPSCPDEVASAPPPVEERDGGADTGGAMLPIELLTAGDYAPLTGEDLPSGGMMTHIVDAAFRQAELSNPTEIDFVNDWGAHLTPLLEKRKYDFGFPWFRPNCDDPGSLPADMRIRCDFAWSDPLYSVSIALYYYPGSGASQPTSFQDLQGKRICRPAGYYTFDLADRGLRDDDTAQTVTLVRPSSVAGCVNRFADREDPIDFMSLNRFTAETALAENDPHNQIKPVETLVYTLDLHLVAHQDHARAAHAWMRKFNEGLRRLRESGQHDRIVSFHQQKHRDRLAELASD
jgi:polar amino acid transport system substrate-binding protein